MAAFVLICPRCGRSSLIWDGSADSGCVCHGCGLQYQSFLELLEGKELERAAKREAETRKLMRARYYRRGKSGALRQVGHDT